MGVTYMRLGKPNESLPLFNELLKLSRECGSGEELLLDIHNLAWAYSELEQTKDAQRLFEEVANLSEKIGLQMCSTARASKNSLALLHIDNGHYQKSETMLEEILDYNQRILTLPNHDDNMLMLRTNLASVYIHQGRFQEASESLWESKQISSSYYGDGHPLTKRIREMLWWAYCSSGIIDDNASIVFHEGVLYGQFEMPSRKTL